jgi:hypothetical protein
LTAFSGLFRHIARFGARTGRAPGRTPLALGAAILLASGLGASTQEMDEHQIRCMQIEQELSNSWTFSHDERDRLPAIEAEIKQFDRVYQGTQAAMEREGCYESFFIFGRGLVRTPKCLRMNERVEDARRQLSRLQQQREAIQRSGKGQRRNQELQEALARAGCAPQPRQREAARRQGGLFDWFTGGEREPAPQQHYSTSRIVPGVPYRTVCVRMCDGFFFPVSYSATSSNFSYDAQRCQQNCAAPAELFVFRNPGEQIEQAVSLDGTPYQNLDVAFRYRREYVKGCSCKVAEYSPIEIEAAGRPAEPGEATARASRATSQGQKQGPYAVPVPSPDAAEPEAADSAADPQAAPPSAGEIGDWGTSVQGDDAGGTGHFTLPQNLDLGITGSPSDALNFEDEDAETSQPEQPAAEAPPPGQQSTVIQRSPPRQ